MLQFDIAASDPECTCLQCLTLTFMTTVKQNLFLLSLAPKQFGSCIKLVFTTPGHCFCQKLSDLTDGVGEWPKHRKLWHICQTAVGTVKTECLALNAPITVQKTADRQECSVEIGHVSVWLPSAHDENK